MAIGVAAIAAFIQAALTILNMFFLGDDVGVIITTGSEIVLFAGFGIAVIRKRLWGAIALLGLSLLEFAFHIYTDKGILIPALFVVLYGIATNSIARAHHISPRLSDLNRQYIVIFTLYVLGVGGLVGFVGGFMRWDKILATTPLMSWVVTAALLMAVFAQAARRGAPWLLETALAVGVTSTLIGFIIDLPVNLYKGATWGNAALAQISTGIFTMACGVLGWGIAQVTPPPKSKTKHPQANYFLRHWLGELSLARSFWVNCLLVTIGLSALSKFLEYGEFFDGNPLRLIRVSMAIIVLSSVIWVWQIIGLWRSAQNHIAATSRRFWARTAQGSVVLWGMVIFAMVPALTELSKISFGLDEINDYTVTLSSDKKAIIVNGMLAFGVTEAVRHKLNDSNQIQLIHLNSIGGRTAEGGMLHDLIKQEQLSTYTDAGCLSACTLAWMAGKKRILNEKAKLGFHQGSFPGLPYQWLKQSDDKAKQYYLNAGVSKEFVDKAFRTPADNMWYPSLDELIVAGVITHTSDGISTTDRRLHN